MGDHLPGLHIPDYEWRGEDEVMLKYKIRLNMFGVNSDSVVQVRAQIVSTLLPHTSLYLLKQFLFLNDPLSQKH
jgi:hypothetical protein